MLPERDEAMIRYYADRAGEYDRIYELPERQDDLVRLRALLRRWAAGRRIVEIACGTGYWTHELAATAQSIRASDAAPAVLEVARGREYACPVVFTVGDALEPGHTRGGAAGSAGVGQWGEPDMLFAGFLVSHLRRETIGGFFRAWERRMGTGRVLVFVDNRYVEESNRPVVRTDAGGNAYQRRRLDSGAEHEVLKNFFTPEELETLVGSRGQALEIIELDHYWAMRYRVSGA